MPGGSSTTAVSARDTDRFTAAYRVVFRLLGDPVVADVLAREAMVRAGGALPTPRPRSLAARTCLQAAALALKDEPWLGRPRSLPSGTGFGETAHADERRQLRMAVRILLGRQRQVFVLEHLAGWGPERVAAEFGLAVEAERRLSAQVIAAVRRRISDQTAQGAAPIGGSAGATPAGAA